MKLHFTLVFKLLSSNCMYSALVFKFSWFHIPVFSIPVFSMHTRVFHNRVFHTSQLIQRENSKLDTITMHAITHLEALNINRQPRAKRRLGFTQFHTFNAIFISGRGTRCTYLNINICGTRKQKSGSL